MDCGGDAGGALPGTVPLRVLPGETVMVPLLLVPEGAAGAGADSTGGGFAGSVFVFDGTAAVAAGGGLLVLMLVFVSAGGTAALKETCVFDVGAGSAAEEGVKIVATVAAEAVVSKVFATPDCCGCVEGKNCAGALLATAVAVAASVFAAAVPVAGVSGATEVSTMVLDDMGGASVAMDTAAGGLVAMVMGRVARVLGGRGSEACCAAADTAATAPAGVLVGIMLSAGSGAAGTTAAAAAADEMEVVVDTTGSGGASSGEEELFGSAGPDPGPNPAGGPNDGGPTW